MTNEEPVQEAAAGLSNLDVQNQLERILASENFCLPKRARSFLRFIVEETLAGRSRYLKACTITNSVFERKNFDAQNDPAVRIEARRIRRELERFYLLSRRSEPVLITIPKGGYVPSFAANEEFCGPRAAAPSVSPGRPTDPAAGNQRARRAILWAGGISLSASAVLMTLLIPHHHASIETASEAATKPPALSLIIEPFDVPGSDSRAAELSRFLRDEIVVKLVTGGTLTVIMQSSSFERSQGERYLLRGSVGVSAENARLKIWLIREANGAALCSGDYELAQRNGSAFESEQAVVNEVARDVAWQLKVASPSTLATEEDRNVRCNLEALT